MRTYSWIAILLLAMQEFVSAYRHHPKARKLRDQYVCEPIRVSQCMDIGYNMTRMPNKFLHRSQEEAGDAFYMFLPLISTNCSDDLKDLLCSFHVPICLKNYQKPIPACRQVCERARTGCVPILKMYKLQWPPEMKCEDLPYYGDSERVCMDFNKTRERRPHKKPSPPTFTTTNGKRCECRCRNHLLSLNSTFASVVVNGENCAVGCDGVTHFTPQESSFARYWILFWASLCLLATLATVTTYLVDTERFTYPERPIVFIGACYAMVSLGYLLRLMDTEGTSTCEYHAGQYLARNSKMDKPMLCIVQFVLIYFFGSAACIWWVMLSMTWFLAAGLKWAQEAIESYAVYFHMVAWLIPCVKTSLALGLRAVDADSLSGICSIGNLDSHNLKVFVIIPFVLYLGVGIGFLLAGFVSLFRIRNAIKIQGRDKTATLEKLMMRIGVFSLLYTVPATAVVTCAIYEFIFRDKWQTTVVCECKNNDKPDYPVFMLKYFASLVVGITSGFWVWSGKTVVSWREFYRKWFCTSNNNRHANAGSDCTASTSTTSRRSIAKSGIVYRAPVEGRLSNALPSNEALISSAYDALNFQKNASRI